MTALLEAVERLAGWHAFGLGVTAGGVAGWIGRAWRDAARGREMREKLRRSIEQEVDARLQAEDRP